MWSHLPKMDTVVLRFLYMQAHLALKKWNRLLHSLALEVACDCLAGSMCQRGLDSFERNGSFPAPLCWHPGPCCKEAQATCWRRTEPLSQLPQLPSHLSASTTLPAR